MKILESIACGSIYGALVFAESANWEGKEYTTRSPIEISWIRDLEDTTPSRFIYGLNSSGELVYAAEHIVRDKDGARLGKELRLGRYDLNGNNINIATIPMGDIIVSLQTDDPFPRAIIQEESTYKLFIESHDGTINIYNISATGVTVSTNKLGCNIREYINARPRYQWIGRIEGGRYAFAGNWSRSEGGSAAFVGVCDINGQTSWIDMHETDKHNVISSASIERGGVAIAINSGVYNILGGGEKSEVHAVYYDFNGVPLQRVSALGRNGSVGASGGEVYLAYDAGDGAFRRRVMLRRAGGAVVGSNDLSIAEWIDSDVPGVARVASIDGGIVVAGIVPGDNPNNVFDSKLLVARYSGGIKQWEWRSGARPPVRESLRMAVSGKRLYVTYESILPSNNRVGVRVVALELQ